METKIPMASERLRSAASADDSGDGAQGEMIDMEGALTAVFSKQGQPDRFIKAASTEIHNHQKSIIDTLATHRHNISENLHTLLETHDALLDNLSSLHAQTSTASDTTNTVTSSLEELRTRTTVRRNLDTALALATRIRQLTRIMARIEDVLDSKKLYTAWRMLQALQIERYVDHNDLYLRQLIPDVNRLKRRLVSLTKRSVDTWISTVRDFEATLGRYALWHATRQAAVQQSLLDAPRGPLGQPFTLLPLLPQPAPRVMGARPWRPFLTSDADAEKQRWDPSVEATRKPAPRSVPNTSTHLHHEARDEVYEAEMNERQQPKLFLRTLLQAVHVAYGLDLLTDIRTDYCNRRRDSLENILSETIEKAPSKSMTQERTGPEDISQIRPKIDETTNPANTERMESTLIDGTTPQTAAESVNFSTKPTNSSDGILGELQVQEGHKKAESIETLVHRVAGFFIVERAVEVNTSHPLVPRSTVDSDWWSAAYAKLLSTFKLFEESQTEQLPDKMKVRSLEEQFERFAEVNSFIR